jgi:hypothetical protein
VPPTNTRRASGATRKPPVQETVSFGHDIAGTIRETDRGFELFGPDGKYLHTEMTLQAARKALYERATMAGAAA